LPLIRPESMPRAEITSYKATREVQMDFWIVIRRRVDSGRLLL
jgi:hypothetical protein